VKCFVNLKLQHLTLIVNFDRSTLKTEAQRSFETRGTNRPGTQRNIPEDLTLLLTASFIKTNKKSTKIVL
jgi:hypothetical protein